MTTDNSFYLTFGSQLLRPSTYKITVTTYTQGYNTMMNTATLRNQKNNYPIRVKENDFQFTIQCKNINEYDILKREVRNSHQKSLVNAAQGICRFRCPILSIDYLGYITQSAEGVARFDYTPMLPLTMLLIKDTINTITTHAYQSVDWTQIYGTNIADLYEASTDNFDSADGISSNNKPVAPYNPTGAGSANSAEHDASPIGGGGGGRPATAQ